MIGEYIPAKRVDERFEISAMQRRWNEQPEVEVITRNRRDHRLVANRSEMFGNDVSDSISEPLHRRQVEVERRVSHRLATRSKRRLSLHD